MGSGSWGGVVGATGGGEAGACVHVGSGSWGGVVGAAGGGEAGACARGVRDLGLGGG